MDAQDESSPDIVKMKLVLGICRFLKEELTLCSKEDKESLTVAIDCLESVYNFSYDIIIRNHTIQPICLKPVVGQGVLNAETFKDKGNKYMATKQYKEAARMYTRAIEIDSSIATYFCNRAAAYCHLKEFKRAVTDSIMAIKLDPTYVKAYGRLGYCYEQLEQYTLAMDAYEEACKRDPSNAEYKERYGFLLERVTKVRINESTNGQATRSNNRGSASTSGVGTSAGSRIRVSPTFLNHPYLGNLASEILADDAVHASLLGAFQSPTGGNPTLQRLISLGSRFAAFERFADTPGNSASGSHN